MTNKQQIQTQEANETDGLAKWVIKNKKTVVAVLVTAVVLVGIFLIADHLRDKSYQKQWSKVFIAEMQIANGGDPSNYAPLEEMANTYKKKPAGVYASFILGSVLMQQGEFLKAEVFYKQALKYANEEFAPIITNTFIANTMEIGDFDKAVTIADDFIAKYPTHFSVPQIKTYKAMALKLAGKLEEAKELFKSIEEDYPQTYYAAMATAELAPAQEVKPEPKKEAKKATKKTSKKK